MLTGQLSCDGHLGERGRRHAQERERRAHRGPEEEPRGAGEDGPGDREVDEHEERDVEQRPERAEIVDEVASLVRVRDVAGEGERADDGDADRRVDGDAPDGNSPRLHGVRVDLRPLSAAATGVTRKA
jgi:hypothetical protein